MCFDWPGKKKLQNATANITFWNQQAKHLDHNVLRPESAPAKCVVSDSPDMLSNNPFCHWAVVIATKEVWMDTKQSTVSKTTTQNQVFYANDFGHWLWIACAKRVKHCDFGWGNMFSFFGAMVRFQALNGWIIVFSCFGWFQRTMAQANARIWALI